MTSRIYHVLLLALFMAVSAHAKIVEPGEFVFSWDGNNGSLYAREASVNRVLQEISEQTGIPIKLQRSKNATVTVNLTDVPMENIIRQVAEGSVITYAKDPSTEEYKIDRIVTVESVDTDVEEQDIQVLGRSAQPAIRIPPNVNGPIIYTGIGAVISWGPRRQGVWVKPISPDSPAGKVGFEKGELVIAIDGRNLTEFRTLDEVSAAIRGPADTVVRLKIRKRNGTVSMKDVVRELYEFDTEGKKRAQ